ncbi:MAG: c-type cytochrome domain-containing protein [Verrucomicrobiota bacterium]
METIQYPCEPIDIDRIAPQTTPDLELKRTSRIRVFFGPIPAAASLLIAASQATAVEEEEISFNRDIRPIFSETCFNCHGPDEASREANLRFDIPESALAKRDNDYFAIVPGKPQDSEAWLLINDEDPDFRMPPPDSHLTLTELQKEKIRKWIEQGAKYEKHWAFVPPIKSKPPASAKPHWNQNPIDAFVLEALENAKLTPNPEADKRALIRRLSFDLRSIPPSIEEINTFIEDQGTHIRDIHATLLHCLGINH